jgi:cytochrome c biogenesis protein CcmG, thiol:disulfide interchange protein DsbE
MTNSSLIKLLALGFLSTSAAIGCGSGESGNTTTTPTSGDNGGAAHPLLNNPGPDFNADTVNGKGKASFAGNKGKVQIVDFWATWCEPCKKSFPKLQELYTKYKGQMEILAISEDDENNGLKDFGDAHGGAKFPLLWDNGKAIAGKWQPRSMPATFIVDKAGVVKFVHLGYHDGEEVEIEKELKGLM